MIEKFKTLFFVKSSLISLYLALTIPLPFISIEKLKNPSIYCNFCLRTLFDNQYH